jgi:hypothetical protein
MSEYQYYEFQAIDRPLDERAQRELRSITSRAEITSTSLVNVYHWGDFKGDPIKLMEKYFDAFLYVANWGTHRLMLRVPRSAFDVEAAQVYCAEPGFSLLVRKQHVILEFVSDDEEGGDWDDGEHWLASLLPLRADLLAGDLRCLYLAWLSSLDFGEVDDDTPEPPVPPGLHKLSGPLKSFAEFMRVDDDLITLARNADSGEAPLGPTEEEMATWVSALSEGEKNSILLRALQGDDLYLRAGLLRRFRSDWSAARQKDGKANIPDRTGRTTGELLAARDTAAEERRRREAERKAREQERRAREQAAARALYLDQLSRREASAWQEVETRIQTKQPKEYDEAVTLLKDLRELAERQGQREEALSRIRQLRERHGKKPSLMERFDKAGFSR